MARFFDGVDDVLEASDSTSLRSPSTALTIGGWFYPGSGTGTDGEIIGKDYSASDPWISYILWQSGSTSGLGMSFGISSSSAGSLAWITSAVQLTTEAWHFAAGTWASGTPLRLRVWTAAGTSVIDQQSGSSISYTLPYSTIPLRVGRNYGGRIARVGVHNAVLSDAQIDAWRTTGTPPIQLSAGFWPLTGAAVEPDYHQTNDLTVYGATYTILNATQGTQNNQIEYVGSGWIVAESESVCDTVDAYALVRFTGTRIDYYSWAWNDHGIIAISVDGGPESMVDTYSPDFGSGELFEYASPTLTYGTHTLQLRVTGTQNAAAVGHVLSIVKFVVTTEYLDDPTLTARTGSTFYFTTVHANNEVTVGSDAKKLADFAAATAVKTTTNKNTATGPTTGLQLTDSAVAGTDGTPIAWYTPQLAAVTISGAASWAAYARESSTAANAALSMRVERCSADGTVLSTIVNQSTSQGAGELSTTAGGATDSGSVSAANVADTALSAGDRLRFSAWIDDSNSHGGVGTMATGHNCQFYYGHNVANGRASFTLAETVTEYLPSPDATIAAVSAAASAAIAAPTPRTGSTPAQSSVTDTVDVPAVTVAQGVVVQPSSISRAAAIAAPTPKTGAGPAPSSVARTANVAAAFIVTAQGVAPYSIVCVGSVTAPVVQQGIGAQPTALAGTSTLAAISIITTQSTVVVAVAVARSLVLAAAGLSAGVQPVPTSVVASAGSGAPVIAFGSGPAPIALSRTVVIGLAFVPSVPYTPTPTGVTVVSSGLSTVTISASPLSQATVVASGVSQVSLSDPGTTSAEIGAP